ncbi:MAG: hypothetical protein R3357_16505, partial [Burkholderiales bacterium]|nr:hypothetical protein [Burkholderiales bacterium]
AAKAAPEPPPAPRMPPPLTRQQMRTVTVDQLLDRGNQMLRLRALTEPKGNNALESFLHALVLSPDNASAQAGVEQVASIYAGWLRDAVARGDKAKASAHLEQLRFVMHEMEVRDWPRNRLAPLREEYSRVLNAFAELR